MQKPNGYDNAPILGEYKPLPAGGYVCRIMQVEEGQSKSGNDMITISLDIYEGDFADYYALQYKNDKRDNKKWGCRVFQTVLNSNGFTNAGFKTFLTSVERSNPGFAVQWGERFCECLKGRLVGGLFGREEYENNSGALKWNTKCRSFRSVDTIRNGDYEIPEDKPLAPTSYGAPDADGFMNIPDSVDDEGLPFN